jgi:hypothetical protein
MALKRPRCENCGAKIYPKIKIFRVSGFPLRGDIPAYCPDCGKELSNLTRMQVDSYDTNLYGIMCASSCLVVVVIVIGMNLLNLQR